MLCNWCKHHGSRSVSKAQGMNCRYHRRIRSVKQGLAKIYKDLGTLPIFYSNSSCTSSLMSFGFI
jgi:hypothetical protein